MGEDVQEGLKSLCFTYVTADQFNEMLNCILTFLVFCLFQCQLKNPKKVSAVFCTHSKSVLGAHVRFTRGNITVNANVLQIGIKMHKANTNFGRGEQNVLKEKKKKFLISFGNENLCVLLRTFVSCLLSWFHNQQRSGGTAKGKIPVPAAGCPELSKIPFC